MGQALYRKYRSKSLDEIVGQSHITDMLRRAIKADKISHAYLLTGPRGVGKTSIARILAHEINQLPYTDESTHLDIIEIDAASNNSVEDIRDLRERVLIAPTSARKKIYIIDEVHMLSKPAFNALLKTLEEPPEHVVFILATTDADKLPATIISRVQRFNFRAIHPNDAASHLRMIADAEQIAIDDEALALIAHHGKGSFRDSIGLLDQLQHLSDTAISRQLIEQVLGLADEAIITELLTAHRAGDIARIASLLDDSEQRGAPAVILAEQLVQAVRREVLSQPELLPLLDALLDISKSAWPQIKLLTALTGNVVRLAPITAPAPPASVSVPATPKPRPANSAKLSAPAVKQAPAPTEKPKAAAPKAPPATAKPEQVATPTPANDADFAWQDFIANVAAASIGAATILKKSGYGFDGKSLTVYAGKKFAKSQLDKAMPALSAALQSLGVAAEINILTEAAPASNSQAAAILDIMGGGEEVSL